MSRIARIKSLLSPDAIEALCRAWLPGGRVQGGAYMVCSPFRQERTASFAVYLKDGGFYDFGSGDSGDIIDLCRRLHGATMTEVIVSFEQMLGIENGNSKNRPEIGHQKRAGRSTGSELGGA